MGRAWVRAGRAAVGELLGVVLPVECGGCGADGARLCATCAARLAGPTPTVSIAACPVPVRASAGYAGVTRQLVVAWKDRGRHDLTGPLAQALAAAVLATLSEPVGRTGDPPLLPAAEGAVARSGRRGMPPSGGGSVARGSPVLLVPVPSSGGTCRRRGADVVGALALGAAARVRAAGMPVRVLPALCLRRTVADQAGLDRSGRASNVEGAMGLRLGAGRAVVGRRCIVVDDVVTTGATAREAIRVLTSAGAVPMGVAVACATPLHSGLSVAGPLH